MFLFLLPILVPSWDQSAIEVTGKDPNPTYKPPEARNRHHAPLQSSCRFIAMPSGVQASCTETTLTTRVTLGEDQPKSSYFYIIDKVLKFLLAAGGLSILRPVMPLPRVWVK